MKILPRDAALMPFWFWNDDLTEQGILGQIADFEAHGVYGFVIHPRVGLPRTLGWMSDGLLHFTQLAVEEAARREMKVILYDEAMYPSGSSCGQVVAANPDFACRCLAIMPAAEMHGNTPLPHGRGSSDPSHRRDACATDHKATDAVEIQQFTGKDGVRYSIVHRKVNAYIRGIHYLGDGPAEDEPAMSDILNPAAVAKFIELVHEKFAARLSPHFGKTILGIFTDEPNALGKVRERKVWPGTKGIVQEVSRLLGEDVSTWLPLLWDEAVPAGEEARAKALREKYLWAIRRRMDETWYRPLSDWCARHHLALCGHPADGDDSGSERFFHYPGQDLVWRFVELGKPSAIEGKESTQGKVSSSAMIHLERRRNSNEFCGAYGHQTTFAEVQWLANWCLVRGVNLLIPHAFYYSVRGPRKDERPPQIGLHTPQWEQGGGFVEFARHCQRLCAINMDSRHVCAIAILTGPDHAPWPAAKALFEHQRDFNYLEAGLMEEKARVTDQGLEIAGMCYQVLVQDGPVDLSPQAQGMVEQMRQAGRVVEWRDNAEEFLAAIASKVEADVTVQAPCADLRYRHMVKEGVSYYMLFNEGVTELKTHVQLSGLTGKEGVWVDTASGAEKPVEQQGGWVDLHMQPMEMRLLKVG